MRFISGFTLAFTSAFACAALLWCALVAGQTGKPTLMSQWIHDVYEKKLTAARRIQTPKIVIVAGSNALFGIDSALLARHLGREVVNLGVNAGILLPATLYRSLEAVRDHDIVILPLEYPMYSYDGRPNLQMIDYIFSRAPGYFFRLTLKEQFFMVWELPVSRLEQGYFYKGGQPVKGLYSAFSIDDLGDQINTGPAFQTQEIAAQLNAHTPNHYGRTFKKNALAWHYIDQFMDQCRRRNVKAIFMPSTLLKFELYAKDRQEQEFYRDIAGIVRERGYRFVGRPQDYMYDKRYYFNTDFHLNQAGRRLRTLQMARDLLTSGLLAGG